METHILVLDEEALHYSTESGWAAICSYEVWTYFKVYQPEEIPKQIKLTISTEPLDNGVKIQPTKDDDEYFLVETSKHPRLLFDWLETKVLSSPNKTIYVSATRIC